MPSISCVHRVLSVRRAHAKADSPCVDRVRNKAVERTAPKLRFGVPYALRAPVAAHLER